MKPAARKELKRIIKTAFELGINKSRLQFYLEVFIDSNFIEIDKKGLHIFNNGEKIKL